MAPQPATVPALEQSQSEAAAPRSRGRVAEIGIEPMLTLAEVCRVLKASRSTLYSWIKCGTVPKPTEFAGKGAGLRWPARVIRDLAEGTQGKPVALVGARGRARVA